MIYLRQNFDWKIEHLIKHISKMKNILFVLFCFGLTYSAESQNLPRIIVLATGGTIAGQEANVDRAGYIPGKLPIEDLLNNIPSINKIAIVKGEQVASVGSYDMTIGIWIKLARRINEIFTKNEADGIVITQGTDTEEETAVKNGILIVRSSWVASGSVTQFNQVFDYQKLGTIAHTCYPQNLARNLARF